MLDFKLLRRITKILKKFTVLRGGFRVRGKYFTTKFDRSPIDIDFALIFQAEFDRSS